MALVYRDRTRETSTSTGTGNFTLAGAQPGFQRFWDHMQAGDTCYYTIVGPSNTWETGLGTMSTANVLTRTQVLESSNGDSAVNFASGTKDVFMSFPALGKWLLGSIQDIATGTLLGRSAAGNGPSQTLTPAEARGLLNLDSIYPRIDDSNIPMKWATVAAVKLTASAAAIIIPIPAGRRSLRVQGLYRTVSDATLQGRISTDGGATYLSNSNSYFSGQRTTQNGANIGSAVGVDSNSMTLSTSGSANPTLPIVAELFAEFEENSCAHFIYNSAGSASNPSSLLISHGLSRTGAIALPTHVMLFPSSGSFLTGTRLIAEAY